VPFGYRDEVSCAVGGHDEERAEQRGSPPKGESALGWWWI